MGDRARASGDPSCSHPAVVQGDAVSPGWDWRCCLPWASPWALVQDLVGELCWMEHMGTSPWGFLWFRPATPCPGFPSPMADKTWGRRGAVHGDQGPSNRDPVTY